ncbi:MAG: methionyl-tRNA formyltransferase [Acidimicrobiales bacterium]
MTETDNRFRPQRLVYLGTPDAAVPPLAALYDAGFDIALVVSRPDRRRGRGSKTTPSPVKAAATDRGLPVTDDLAEAATVGAELGVVVAYGRIIPTPILEQLRMVNIHFSLLPRWRGAAPVERAILAGDAETGVCLMDVAPELDTGAVYQRRTVTIDPDETADDLTARLALIGADLAVTTLREGLDHPDPQTGEVTYAAKIDPAELRLDWARPAAELARVVRIGRAWTTYQGKRLRVVEARPVEAPAAGPVGTIGPDGVAAGTGTLELVTVQPEGKKAMPAAAWLNGVRPGPADHLV